MNLTAEQVGLTSSPLAVKLARTSAEIEQALRLRYEVFAVEEKNFRLMNDSGLEQDEYDEICDHLIVQDLLSGDCVGTYRLLPGERAAGSRGFYSESEFDLSGFDEYKPDALELGRSCVAPAYRNGRAIQLLWEGIADYISQHHLHYLIGCASVHFQYQADLNEMYTFLHRKNMISYSYGVIPLPSHRIGGLQLLDELPGEKEVFRKLPPLMKGYQWLGAEIGGDPAYDRIFNTVDFFIVLEKPRLARRYRRHFLGHG
ncbi:GNAT family N-acetyltransferase [Paenibacillus sp. y28]|uniref:GNAT family N-acetyltransferase n=1 Tax=Paenibacillus sp. y28 TaxID=3129110 RepID=UPI00301999BA